MGLYKGLSLAKEANGYEEWGEGGSFSRNGFMEKAEAICDIERPVERNIVLCQLC